MKKRRPLPHAPIPSSPAASASASPPAGQAAIHLLNGLYDAKMDGTAVLALTGQQYSDLLGTHYQQEVDLLSLYKDVAAFNQMVQGSADVANLVNTACRTALARRTVTHITFPIDYQIAEAKNGYYTEMRRAGPHAASAQPATRRFLSTGGRTRDRPFSQSRTNADGGTAAACRRRTECGFQSCHRCRPRRPRRGR